MEKIEEMKRDECLCMKRSKEGLSVEIKEEIEWGEKVVIKDECNFKEVGEDGEGVVWEMNEEMVGDEIEGVMEDMDKEEKMGD